MADQTVRQAFETSSDHFLFIPKHYDKNFAEGYEMELSKKTQQKFTPNKVDIGTLSILFNNCMHVRQKHRALQENSTKIHAEQS